MKARIFTRSTARARSLCDTACRAEALSEAARLRALVYLWRQA